MIFLVGEPYGVYMVASGKRYVADPNGLIQVIDLNDVIDLKASGATQGPVGARTAADIATVPPTAAAGQTVMAGLAGTITPLVTGNALLMIQGSATNSTASQGGTLQLCHSLVGGEAPPSGGDPLVGNPLGQPILYGVTSGNIKQMAFYVSGYAVGMTLGEAYWYDLAITGVGGGQASISGVSMIAIEL